MSAPPFILDLYSRNGPTEARLPASEGGERVPRHLTHLRIRSDVSGFVAPTYDPDEDQLTGFVPPVFERDGLALLAIIRDHADLPHQPIGLYHARVRDEELDGLREAIEGTAWAALPQPRGGDVNLPTLTIAYQREGLMIERSFNAGNGEFIEAIAPLWSLLDAQLERARKSAASTLELTLHAEADPDAPLQIRVRASLRARGIGPVVFDDPRWPADPARPSLRVRVGERVSDNPHARLANIVELPPPQGAAAAPEAGPTRVVRPNERVERTYAWLAPHPGRYVFEASWVDYAGPTTPARGQTPLMPLPLVGPSSLGAGPYPIRGALFARATIELEPPAV